VTELRNGTLIHRRASGPVPGTTTLRLTRALLIGIAAQAVDLPAALADGQVAIEGDPGDVARLIGAVGDVDPNFPIVTPRRRLK